MRDFRRRGRAHLCFGNKKNGKRQLRVSLEITDEIHHHIQNGEKTIRSFFLTSKKEKYTPVVRKRIVPTELAKTTRRRLAPPSSGKSRLPRPRRPLSRPKMMMMMMMIAPPYSSRNHHRSRKIPLSSRNASRCDSFCSNFFVGCPRQTARKMRRFLCSTATSHSAPPLFYDVCVYLQSVLLE